MLIFCSLCDLYAKSEDPIAIGNFALPTSQQPSPLFSFGQNIVDKGDRFAFTTFACVQGKKQLLIGATPSFLYGVSDTFSLLFNVPIGIHYQQENAVSRGLGDLSVDAEYAFYQKNSATWAAQATVVGGLWLPTGSSTTVPPVGSGTAGFFIGTTYSYMTIKWYCFSSYGASLPVCQRTSTVTPQFFYEAGIGMNLADTVDSIFLGLVEFNGIYTAGGRLQGGARIVGKLFAPLVPGTVIFCGPSLFCSNERWVIQAGIQFPLLQSSQSTSVRVSRRSSFYIAYKF